MDEEILFKRDKTRLFNLLKDYRDHMITNHHSKLPHKNIVGIIEDIDGAINLINFSI